MHTHKRSGNKVQTWESKTQHVGNGVNPMQAMSLGSAQSGEASFINLQQNQITCM